MDKTQLSCFRVEPSAALFCLLASYLPYLTQPYLARTVKDVFCAVFAGYVIACVAAFPRLQGALSVRGLTWLGDISFSFYLIHLPVLMALIYLMYPVAPLGLIISVALPLMLLAGHLMYHAVERPSLELGRSLSQRLQGSKKDG